MNYNLAIIRPPNFYHSSCFREVADSLAWALCALGHHASITDNWLTENECNIIFGCELFSADQRIPAGSIVYNLEQPSHPRMNVVRHLAKGLTVWDYSVRNVERWRASGHDCRHVPIGFTPNLVRIPKAPVQNIDVSFFGFLTERRLKLLDELTKTGLNVYAANNCYGGGRDNIISRSKVCLNVHHDGRDMAEIVRMSYLFANSKCVITESSSDQDDYPWLEVAAISAHYEELEETITAVLQHGDYNGQGAMGYKMFSQLDYTATVSAAIGSESPIQRRYREGCAHGDMKDFLPWLREHARGNVLEIGVRDGASTSALLLGLEKNGGHLTSVDISDCGKLFSHPQWTFMRMNSRDLRLIGTSFDMILIDGDHSRDGYYWDLASCWLWCKPGGMILSHDICPEPGQTLEDVPGSDFPSVAVREEYFKFIAEHSGIEHEELPGRYGMGVLRK